MKPDKWRQFTVDQLRIILARLDEGHPYLYDRMTEAELIEAIERRTPKAQARV